MEYKELKTASLGKCGCFHFLFVLTAIFFMTRANNSLTSYIMNSRLPTMICVDKEYMDSSLSPNRTNISFIDKIGVCPVTEVNNGSCTMWSYDTAANGVTLISDFHLCDWPCLMHLNQAFLVIAFGAGGFLFNVLSDTSGRRRYLIVCIVLDAISSIIGSQSLRFGFQVLMRCTSASVMGGAIAILVTYTEEVFPERQKRYFIYILFCCFSSGYGWIALLGHLMQNWRDLELWNLIPSAPILLLTALFIQESPRWLFQQESLVKCETAWTNIAFFMKLNGMKEKIDDLDRADVQVPILQKKDTFDSLFITVYVSLRTGIIALVWGCHALVYLFITLNAATLFDLYPPATCLIFGVSEMVAVILFGLTQRFASKRKFLIVLLVTTTASLVIVLLTQKLSSDLTSVISMFLHAARLTSWLGVILLVTFTLRLYHSSMRCSALHFFSITSFIFSAAGLILMSIVRIYTFTCVLAIILMLVIILEIIFLPNVTKSDLEDEEIKEYPSSSSQDNEEEERRVDKLKGVEHHETEFL